MADKMVTLHDMTDRSWSQTVSSTGRFPKSTAINAPVMTETDVRTP